jgi:hypothetical protein
MAPTLARVDVDRSLMPWISWISLTLGVDLQGPRIVAVESTRARFFDSLDSWPGRVAVPSMSKGLAVTLWTCSMTVVLRWM